MQRRKPAGVRRFWRTVGRATPNLPHRRPGRTQALAIGFLFMLEIRAIPGTGTQKTRFLCSKLGLGLVKGLRGSGWIRALAVKLDGLGLKWYKDGIDS